jgi:predicted phosphodiesterase
MIYITGDIHGNIKRFSKKAFPEQKELTCDDIIIIMGDFGVIWSSDADKEEKYDLDILENKKYTIAFIDGNHENFDRLNSFPVIDWHGGNVHQIRSNVFHLMRGQIYDIEGKTFFAFGGASSHDIKGCATPKELEADYTAGILRRDDPDFEEKKQFCRKNELIYRIEGESWWRQEIASEEEMEEGRRNLLANNNEVDYIITHCCATSTQEVIGRASDKPDRQTEYLESIKQTVRFNKWFFGHYHDNRNMNDKETLVYNEMIRIS